jgi:hypothetical protein
MKTLQLLLLTITVMFATGCPSEPSNNFNRKGSLVANINARLADYHDAYNDALSSGNTGEAQRQRNDALELAIAIIDDNYTQFIQRLDTSRSTANFVADVIDLGATAAVGITKGERPNQILGIAVTAFRGGRAKAELNFYKEQTTPILITKMDGYRAEVLTQVLEKKSRPVTAYSMNEAVRDMVSYFNAGTLVRAFTQLSKDTAAQAKTSEDILVEAKKRAGVLGAPTAAQLTASSANRVAIDNLADTFTAEARKVTEADAKIESANKKISDANKAIADESVKPNPDQTVINNANEAKTAAQTEKTQATTARTAAIKAREAALAKMRTAYKAIEDDTALSPLLDEIPGLPGYSDQLRQTLRATLDRLKAGEGTAEDYALILKQMNKLVVANLVEDPTLNERLHNILAAANQ